MASSVCTVHAGNHEEEPVVIDHQLYTEYALRQRGFIPRSGGWLTGFYHWNRPKAVVGCGAPDDPDEYGWGEIAFCPIGEQRNNWAELNWKRHYPGIYAWYMNDGDMRAFRHGCLLFIKSDVYIHTEGTLDESAYFGKEN